MILRLYPYFFAALAGVVVSIIGLARKEKPQLSSAAPGTPAASAPVQAPSAPNPVQDPADASSVKQLPDDSMWK